MVDPAAASSEARYLMMFSSSPVPMWTYDRETLQFVTVNDAALLHYGYSRDEFLAMTLADIRPTEDVEALRADVRGARGLAGAQVWRHRKKDGSLIGVEIAASDFIDRGRPVRLVLVTDITVRDRALQSLRETEAQLHRAQRMEALGRIAGGVAHDFNNVLTIVETYASMLEATFDSADPRREDTTEIRRASERAAAITGQLSLLSQAGVAEPCALDLDAVIAGFGSMLRRLCGPQVTLVAPRASVPEVIADRGQIEQVLMNLAINARDAMPDGGRLTIEVQQVAAAGRTYVDLTVTDTGIGMDAATQQRIFDPFFTTKGVGKGTGLGLAIAHDIVTRAGGTISVYSELGHGTTFRVRLPAATVVAPAPPIALAPAPRTLPAMTILVVDEEPVVRGVIARILREAGCRVLEAASADEARGLCVSHDGTIEVVVFDVAIAGGRTEALVHELAELRPAIKTVAMSGYPAQVGGPAGDTLAKPFDPSQLRAAVARVVAGPAAPPPVVASVRPRVLLADDDAILRRVIVRILQRADMEVVEVDGGRPAIAALKESSFDVIVSDVHMPDGGGLELLRSVRRIDLEVPMILMSGAPDVESASRAVEYGAFRYLTKPLDSGELAATVHQAVRAHALARLRREAFTVTGARGGAMDRAGVEVRFEQAITGLWMAYQPITDAHTGALYGVEALMRTTEPSLAGAQTILDAATQLGRLSQVGRRIRALAGGALASRTDGLALFVNLHPQDLMDIDLIDETAPLTRIASRVILEVTERTTLESSVSLSDRLVRLRKLGFRLAVDDIGAGYSGLTSFTELMPEVVKIDMSLVRDVHLNTLKQRTIAALCKLCHEVGCTVVGEGVETVDERDCLIALGCDLLQGFLLARPSLELPP